MDLALIMIGVLALEIVPRVAGPGVEAESFYSVLVVRGFRLFRLVRALRMLRHFKLIWRLVYGMLAAGQTIISTTALIAIFLFIFSCVAVELISKDRNLTELEPTRDIVRDYFSGLNKTFLTLIQFVTLDSIAEVYYPLIMNKPWLTFYFMPLLIFLSVGLMNLVTAALVENAMETAAHEAEEERQKLKKRVQSALPSLIEIFHELDKDRSGLLTREEVENVPLSVLPPRVLDTIYADSMADIFDYLDVDGTKELTQIEFVEGLLNLCLMDTPISTLQSLKLLQLIRSVVGQVETEMSTLRREMQKLRTFMTTVSM
ncbi:CACNA1I [Symbiodinium necroappetens]|uniref:CACNA1I protein n=1 Tax=Symbiodinium necroappetens TaxID=1628268 RepID=A0A812V1C6_9DINO|nr:CACNA1I [Symbiodinium necroappetens]